MGYQVGNDYLAGIRDLQDARLSVPRSVVQLGIGLSNYLLTFLVGCLIGAWLNERSPTEADRMMERIQHRAALIQLEKQTALKVVK